MKVLLVTGRLASGQVKRCAGGADVLVADVDVAAFITPEMLCRSGPRGYDLILIPGAITADFSEAEEILGTRIRLGPKHAIDLASILPCLDEVELSTTVPACALMEEKRSKEALIQLEGLEARASGQLTLKGVKIGGSSRMKVLAEVVDATRLDELALKEKIRYFEGQGADLIDLGASLDATPASVKRARTSLWWEEQWLKRVYRRWSYLDPDRSHWRRTWPGQEVIQSRRLPIRFSIRP